LNHPDQIINPGILLGVLYSIVLYPGTTNFLPMFIFAHLVCGILLGLFFCSIIHDRRAIPLCIVSSLLPDIIDKPLGLLFPALGCGRSIFHALFIVLIVLIITFAILKNRYVLWGIAVACCFFFHQILDGMWLNLCIWAYPLFGQFPLVAPPDYAGYYLWLEITSPSEWIFFLVTVVMLFKIYSTEQGTSKGGYYLWSVTTVLLAGMGILMVGASLFGVGNTFFAPSYPVVVTCTTGILALAGATVMWQWYRLKPCSNA
jgi:hypothetical protein